MADIIHLLPDHVANQIAAGEVVQRPSSVVKELLENSIDAEATTIKLIVIDAGKTLIQVVDDGIGMSATDARMCFERHATSKISKAEDLFNLQTKGFRGEAMASIAAIAHVELKTKQEQEELGTQIKIEGSKIVGQNFIATSKGTSVAVKNLFYNIPARRNFLKSNTIEMRHIIDEFLRVAMVHPSIAFVLYHNEQEVYHLNPSNLRQRIVAIFGSKMNEKLVPVQETTDIVSITGFVAKPEFSKRKRGEQYFFVNNRFIKNAYLHHAVMSAFDGLLENSAFPSYFLYLEVPKSSIDINIHPTKTEVKFDDEKALYAMLRSTVKHSLGLYNVAPVLDFNRDANLDTPYQYTKKGFIADIPKIEIDPNFNPFKSNHQVDIHFPFQRNQKSEDIEVTFDDDSEIDGSLFSSESIENKSETIQIQRKYIISSIKSGVVLIHQSLAHQRILYEEFLEKTTVSEANSQQLLFPICLSFSMQEMELLLSMKNDLEYIGFTFDAFDDEQLIISGMPSTITESKVNLVIEALLEDAQMQVPDASFSNFDLMAKSFAKTLCIKTGASLSDKERDNLVNSLFSCKEPNVSPFGKPTFKTLTLEELDQIFN